MPHSNDGACVLQAAMPEVPTSVTALMEQQARVARKREAVKAKRAKVDAFRGLPPVRALSAARAYMVHL